MVLIHLIVVRIQIYLFTSGTWENEELRRVFSHFLIDFYFEFFKLFLHPIIDMSDIIQEIMVEILFPLVLIINVFTVLPNMVDCSLDQTIIIYVLAELVVVVYFRLCCHQTDIIEVLLEVFLSQPTIFS